MTEFKSQVTTEKGGPAAGYSVNIITSPGFETDPKDIEVALIVVRILAARCVEKCDRQDCAAKVIGISHGDGLDEPKIETFSIRCKEPCTSGLPAHAVQGGEFVVDPDYTGSN